MQALAGSVRTCSSNSRTCPFMLLSSSGLGYRPFKPGDRGSNPLSSTKHVGARRRLTRTGQELKRAHEFWGCGEIGITLALQAGIRGSIPRCSTKHNLCVAQSGRVLALEASCRRFKSYRADQTSEGRKVGVLIGLENRDGVSSPVRVRPPCLPPTWVHCVMTPNPPVSGGGAQRA